MSEPMGVILVHTTSPRCLFFCPSALCLLSQACHFSCYFFWKSVPNLSLVPWWTESNYIFYAHNNINMTDLINNCVFFSLGMINVRVECLIIPCRSWETHLPSFPQLCPHRENSRLTKLLGSFSSNRPKSACPGAQFLTMYGCHPSP